MHFCWSAFAFIFPLQAPSLLYPLCLRSTAVGYKKSRNSRRSGSPSKIKTYIHIAPAPDHEIYILKRLHYTYKHLRYKYNMISKEHILQINPLNSSTASVLLESYTHQQAFQNTHRKPQRKQKHSTQVKVGPLPVNYPFIFGHV